VKPGAALAALLGLLLPLSFWLCQAMGWPFWFAGVLLLPIAWLRRDTKFARWAALAIALLALWALLGRDALPVRLYPVLVNAGLLVSFGFTLIRPPSMIERFARLQEPELPPRAVRYTRRVTQVWCAFFAANGSAALVTALWMSERAWALYNGFIAYVLIGALFGIEWLVRQRVRRAEGPSNA
jgi:uncharacterized membrane protein